MKLEHAWFHTPQYAVGSRCGNVDLCVPDTEAWRRELAYPSVELDIQTLGLTVGNSKESSEESIRGGAQNRVPVVQRDVALARL